MGISNKRAASPTPPQTPNRRPPPAKKNRSTDVRVRFFADLDDRSTSHLNLQDIAKKHDINNETSHRWRKERQREDLETARRRHCVRKKKSKRSTVFSDAMLKFLLDSQQN